MPQPSAVTPIADPASAAGIVGAGPFGGVPAGGVQVSNGLSGIVQAGSGITGATLAAATVLQGSVNDAGARRRVVCLVSTCNQPVHLVLQLAPASPGTTGFSVALDVTIAAFSGGSKTLETLLGGSSGRENGGHGNGRGNSRGNSEGFGRSRSATHEEYAYADQGITDDDIPF